MAMCSVHPTRIDLNLLPPAPPSSFGQARIPSFEDGSNFRPSLKRIIDVVGKGAVTDAVSRVAITLQFASLCPTISEANSVLTLAMPERYRMQIADEEDLIFQINVPRIVRDIADIRMNYITKWSVDRLQFVSFSVGAPLPTAHREFITANVLFDINNAPATLL